MHLARHTKKGEKNRHGGAQSFCCANFKPTTSSLKHDLEDAAKAAAEAAAQQAALDIAAKAFCRVSVPALLAPLEAVDDLIPIFGKIADLVEIAATPAIIQGCVKEGSAEFKVFGKKHTVSLNEPTGKPTNVPGRPSASNHPPAKTGDKSEPTCKPKAKRGSKIRAAPKPIPTENIYNTDTTPFKILIKASKISSKEWTVSRNGEGHAMQLSVRPSFFSVPHAIYIAGYFVIGYNDDEVTNKCGEVVHVERTWKREYIAGEYDLLFDTHPDRNPTGACSLGDHAGALTWVTDLEDAFPHYKYLGRIKPGLSNSDIIAQSETVLANMGKYIMVKNNCFTFVKKTYADEAA